jgi:hypothetical protein
MTVLRTILYLLLDSSRTTAYAKIRSIKEANGLIRTLHEEDDDAARRVALVSVAYQQPSIVTAARLTSSTHDRADER